MACDVSFSVLVVQYSFSDLFFMGEEGTCCLDHKMSAAAYGVKNAHVCLD